MSSVIKNQLAQAIKNARANTGWSCDVVSKAMLKKIESGMANVSVDHLAAICDSVGLSGAKAAEALNLIAAGEAELCVSNGCPGLRNSRENLKEVKNLLIRTRSINSITYVEAAEKTGIDRLSIRNRVVGTATIQAHELALLAHGFSLETVDIAKAAGLLSSDEVGLIWKARFTKIA